MTTTRIKRNDRDAHTLNRRTLVGGATAAAAGVALTGAKASAFPAPMINRLQGTIELNFWGGEPEESGPGALVEAFNARDPSIQVRYTRYVNDDTGNTQLDTALQGGTPIDVYKTYSIPRLGARIGAGAAEDLTAYVEADPEVSAWVAEETEGIFTYEDTLYSLPTVRSPHVLIANQRMLEEAEMTLPEQWTIDEFRTMAAGLSSDDVVFGAYSTPDIARQILGGNYWYKEGGAESNFDHPAFRQNLETHRGMIEDGSAFPWELVLAQDLRVYQHGLFLTEQTGLWASELFVLRYINDLTEFPHDFVTTFTSLPRPADADPVYNPGALNNWVMINPSSEYKEAAWEFIKFRLTEGAVHYLRSAKIPAFPGTDQQVIVESMLGPDRDTLYDVESFERAVFDPNIILVSDTITTAGAQIQQINQQLADQYFIGEIDLDECLTEMKQQSDEAIQQASE